MQPDQVFIDEVLHKWPTDLERLEFDHNYIQWLFPTSEPGQNPCAQELQPEEARAIMSDPQARDRSDFFHFSFEVIHLKNHLNCG
jgi:hypothetical protein